MLYELFLGMRYLKAKRKQTFISVITVISVAGVMVGVMSLIVVLSVMNGFREDLMSKILGVNSHILVLSYDGALTEYEKLEKKINAIEGIKATTPFIYSQVMVNSQVGVSGALFRGINTQSAGNVISIEPMIKKGSLLSLDRPHDGLPTIIIGTELSKQIGSPLGSILTVVSPQGKLTPMGRAPSSRKYKVTAIFESGMYEYDSAMVYVSLKEAQDFLGMDNRVTGIEVKVDDIHKTDLISKAINHILGYPYWTKDWKNMNKSLVAALKLEKMTMFVILTMIVLVGALNIISTLVMVVMEKTRDMAILRAMGATAKSIMAIFMIQGLLVGLVGTLAGLGSGLGICYLISEYIMIDIPTDFYGLTTLPVRVERLDVVLVALAGIFISFMATLYPSWHASRLNPVEALRYE
ncbi:MAG: lipoprotein-releasing ABC transporter permease subunit [Thermodesulfobacteriota bacterium]|nr:lipoprotein-releasing ABC transporter permease subunit [Thermodesulfobacteriota bacterium]